MQKHQFALAVVFLLLLSNASASLRGLQQVSSTLKPSTSTANWAPSNVYSVGAMVSYNGATYKCIQAHTSNLEWNPQSTPSLWQPVSTTCNSVPNAPTGLTASSTSTSSTTLTWTKVTPPAGCLVFGYTIFQNGVAITTGITSNTYQVQGLTASTSYQFAIGAVNSAGNSSNSASITVTTLGGNNQNPSPAPTPAPQPAPSQSSKKEFVPYVDMGLTQMRNLTEISRQSGVKKFTLAFIQGDGCTPKWFGQYAVPGETDLKSIIDAYGKDNIIISFGGAAGTELAESCGTVASTQAAYHSVIDYYGVQNLDFDIEGEVLGRDDITDIRNQALANLQKANPGLVISYTLPAVPTGLGGEGVKLMASAKKYGVNVSLVNLMTMDYGAYYNPNAMADNAINAVKNAMAQMSAQGQTPQMGITPMIGINDVVQEVFTLADAQTVLAYAQSEPRVQRLAMWSIARDNGDCVGTVSYGCSGVSQSDYAFASIFNKIQN
jgi:chitodextrinase